MKGRAVVVYKERSHGTRLSMLRGCSLRIAVSTFAYGLLPKRSRWWRRRRR